MSTWGENRDIAELLNRFDDENADCLDHVEAEDDLWELIVNGRDLDQTKEILDHILGRLPDDPWRIGTLKSALLSLERIRDTRVAGVLAGALQHHRETLIALLDDNCEPDSDPLPICELHSLVAELVLSFEPTFEGRVRSLLHSSPSFHRGLWAVLEERNALYRLTDEELELCFLHSPVASVQAALHLASRGSAFGADAIRAALRRKDPFLSPTMRHAEVIASRPGLLAPDILDKFYERCSDLIGMESLACSILRAATQDSRDGWTEMTVDTTSVQTKVRHPHVPTAVSQQTSEVARTRASYLGRLARLRAVDTDLWDLFRVDISLL